MLLFNTFLRATLSLRAFVVKSGG